MWFWKMESNVDHKWHRDIAFTSDFCDNHSHPVSPGSLYLTSPHPILDVLKFLVSRPQVPSPHTRIPMSPSPCPRPTFIHSQDLWCAQDNLHIPPCCWVRTTPKPTGEAPAMIHVQQPTLKLASVSTWVFRCFSSSKAVCCSVTHDTLSGQLLNRLGHGHYVWHELWGILDKIHKQLYFTRIFGRSCISNGSYLLFAWIYMYAVTSQLMAEECRLWQPNSHLSPFTVNPTSLSLSSTA